LLAFFAFFLVAMVLFSLPLFMDHHNDQLLRLIECIESLKSEVKQKMMCRERRSAVRKSLRDDFNFPISCFATTFEFFGATSPSILRPRNRLCPDTRPCLLAIRASHHLLLWKPKLET
jgi:hypothetical protein